MNKEKKYGVWEYLFQGGFSPERYQIISNTATSRAQAFMSRINNGEVSVDDGLNPQSFNFTLDQWVSENDHLLTELVHDIQSHILSGVEFSLPAHDERQIMFKDAAEGLRFYQMEKPQGYKTTFVIPMFAHDIGRLLEGRFYDPFNNPHDQWTPHSKFSFMMLEKILEQPQYETIPRALKDHFLYAVLAHSGDNGKSYMSRAVQTCDRMQLIGAEGFYRALSYGTCLMDADIKYPEDPRYEFNLPSMFEHQSVLSMLEYCSRNMRENIGEDHASWQHRIAVENVVLLKAACEGNEDLTSRIFAPELNPDATFGHQKRRINAAVMGDAENAYNRIKTIEMRWSPYEVATTAIQAIEIPTGAAKLSDQMRKSIHRAVGEMSEAERKSLFRLMVIANQFRSEQDEIDLAVSLKSKADPKGYIRAIADATLKYADSHPANALGLGALALPLDSLSPS